MQTKILQIIQKNQKILIVIFAALVSLFFVFLFLKTFSVQEIPIIPNVLPRPENIKINFKILDNPILKELESVEQGSLPVEKGRENPFIPFTEEQKIEEPELVETSEQ